MASKLDRVSHSVSHNFSIFPSLPYLSPLLSMEAGCCRECPLAVPVVPSSLSATSERIRDGSFSLSLTHTPTNPIIISTYRARARVCVGSKISRFGIIHVVLSPVCCSPPPLPSFFFSSCCLQDMCHTTQKRAEREKEVLGTLRTSKERGKNLSREMSKNKHTQSNDDVCRACLQEISPLKEASLIPDFACMATIPATYLNRRDLCF